MARVDGKVALVTGAGGGIGREACIKLARETFGKLDVLFNNAGVMLSGDDDAITTDEASWFERRRRLPQVPCESKLTCDVRRTSAPEVVAFFACGGLTAAYVTPE